MNLQLVNTIAVFLSIVFHLALITLVLFAIPVFREVRAWLKGSEQLRSLVRDLTPAVTNAAENVNYLSAALRSDVDELGSAVRRATETTYLIIDAVRDRAAEINGFLEVVQEEAEGTFLNTAALLRGVRGARARGREREDDELEESGARRRRLG